MTMTSFSVLRIFKANNEEELYLLAVSPFVYKRTDDDDDDDDGQH